MDVVRLFDFEDADFTHYFYFQGEKYINCIQYMDEIYDFCESYPTQDDVQFKRYARRSAKLAFYELLNKVTGISFPYGALTGIRPTKLAYMEEGEGRDFKELFARMHVAADNIDFVGRVMREQRPYYAAGGGQELFISLPFCPTKCRYCSFITAPISSTGQYVDDYISCLERELASLAPMLGRVNSVYIGGGTPFAISAAQLKRVYAAVAALRLPDCEYTVEAGRPDVFTREKLQLSRDFGVNRICVNPQTFSDVTLQKIGRKHTTAQTYEAYQAAKEYGFDINIDLIAGLEGEEVASAGYSPYYMYRQKYQAGGHENCGWALPGKACAYNIGVMEEISDNIAVGANAISKRVFAGQNRIERCASPKDIPTYISKCDKIISERSKLFGTE